MADHDHASESERAPDNDAPRRATAPAKEVGATLAGAGTAPARAVAPDATRSPDAASLGMRQVKAKLVTGAASDPAEREAKTPGSIPPSLTPTMPPALMPTPSGASTSGFGPSSFQSSAGNLAVQDAAADSYVTAVSWPVTPQGVANMSDTTVQVELYEASRTLSRTDLADRNKARADRDLLETEVVKRGLSKAVPASGANEFTIEGVTFSEDPEHVRYVLETLVAEKGTSVTGQIVRQVDLETTAIGQASRVLDAAAVSLLGLTVPEPTFPTPALATVVTQQWALLKAENDQIIKEATVFGNQLMAEALAKSMEQVEAENERYGWSSQPRGYTARQYQEEKLAEEQRLGQAARDLVAKKGQLDQAMVAIGGLEYQMNAVVSESEVLLEHLSSEISALEPARDQARSDLLTTELAYAKEFPVLSAYLSRGDWNGLKEIADDPTDWHYGSRIKETLTNIVEVQDALKEGDTSCWKQDRIVDLMRNYYSIPEYSMRSRLFDEAVAEAKEDPWWKKALTFIAIGLSLLAAIPTGGQSLAVTAVVLTAEGAALTLDLYMLHEAYSEYQLATAATGTDFDVAKALSSVEPSLFWLAVQVVATGVSGAGAVRSFRQILGARAAIRAASSSDELVSSIKALDSELEQAGVSAASRERAVAESLPTNLTPDEIVQTAAEAGIEVSDTAAAAAAGTYPGARPGLVVRPSNAPLEGTAVGSTGRKWKHRTVSMGEIQPTTDVLGEKYWRFPDLADDEVLIFPSGYRVWKQPGTEAIVEEAVVGPSVSPMRSVTRGEEAIYAAKDMSAAHAAAGTQRAHGAGAPGLGFDAPYGVVHAPKAVNLGFENAGVERWVRELRDAAPPGVDFVYSTATIKKGMNLQQRVYKISAIADGEIHDMYEFTLRMKPGGLGDDAVEFLADETTVFSGADRFTAPVSASKSATAGKATHVEPPPKLRAALDRAKAVKDVPHEGLSGTLERLTSLKNTMETVFEKRIKPLGKGATKAQTQEIPTWLDALHELKGKMGRLEDHLATAPPDARRLDEIAQAAMKFYTWAARWPDKVTPAKLRAFTRQLDEFLD